MSAITYTYPYFEYNGTSSQISVADNAVLEPGTGSWTMEAWVYQTSSGTQKVILGKFRTGGANIDVSYAIRVNNATGNNAQFSSGTTGVAIGTNFSGILNTWYQLVYVFSNPLNTIRSYVNGSFWGSNSNTFGTTLNTTNPLYIGSYNGGELNQYYAGRIGITRLYNTALSDAEVLQNYNADKEKYGL